MKSLFPAAGMLAFAAMLAGCGASRSEISNASPVSTASSVTTTNNPQVADYTYTAPGAGSVVVQFGPTTSYGRRTSAVTTTAAGRVSILVAGMLATTTYHMQAVYTAANGATDSDPDQTFTTGSVPAKFVGTVTASTTSGRTPQPGIEMLNGLGILTSTMPSLFATDLSGNIIWTYPFSDQASGLVALPVRMLSNGDLLLFVTHNSSTVLADPNYVDTASEMREITLAGDTVKSLTVTQLNASLQTAGADFQIGGFSHDVLPLANGHFLVLGTVTKQVTLNGATTPTAVLGDAVIDLDSTYTPVWTWNAFDHLDPNRHPYMFPDWTHANSVSYDAADGSLLVSLRHQNWVLKLNYNNGAGDGAIQWTLGPEGDFQLLDAQGNPDALAEDWFYSQHYANYLTTSPTGVITMSLMDNGDDRQFSDGSSCPVNGGSYCFTTIKLFTIDPMAKTVQPAFNSVLNPTLYSFFGGNTDLLANGDVTYDLAGLPGYSAAAYEVTNEASPQPVWSLEMPGALVYRGQRWGSLYPGVQW